MKLTELENNLIARNIIFQKLHKLPKSRWSGTHDRLVNVPVGPQDVINTIQSLPRTPAEAGIIPIIPVNLKRKLEYKNTHLAQLVNTDKIYKYLDFLSKNGHPSYKFYDDFNTYEKRCQVEDPIGSKLFISEGDEIIDDLEEYLVKLQTMEDKGESNAVNRVSDDEGDVIIEEVEEQSVEEKEEEEYMKKEPIQKHQ